MVDQYNLKPYLKVHFYLMNLTVKRPSLFFIRNKKTFCMFKQHVCIKHNIFIIAFFSHTICIEDLKWLPTSVLLPGKSLRPEELVGCSHPEVPSRTWLATSTLPPKSISDTRVAPSHTTNSSERANF